MMNILKLLLISLMILGILFSIGNLISVDNIAQPSVKDGTVQSDGCYGAELNC